jgi:hypothetical protein
MYYFYRYREVANTDGAGMASHPLASQSGTAGGVLMVAKGRRGKPGRAPDGGSERQLMFSNHCTWEEEDEAARAVCAESFLYAVQVGGGEGGWLVGRLLVGWVGWVWGRVGRWVAGLVELPAKTEPRTLLTPPPPVTAPPTPLPPWTAPLPPPPQNRRSSG